jgi:imidazoleglycerol-phosphate dehydratase
MAKKPIIKRKTRETDITIKSFRLRGKGKVKVKSGMNFFGHMLELLAFHAGFDLDIEIKGDLQVDHHHSVEDTGIVLGQAIARQLGKKQGIKRYGQSLLPMDETLVLVGLDFSGRPIYESDLRYKRQTIGDFDTELVDVFMCALASHAGLTLHLKMERSKNTHHLIEAAFKATGRALRMALERGKTATSTKGRID